MRLRRQDPGGQRPARPDAAPAGNKRRDLPDQPRRIRRAATDHNDLFDGFGALSPDGKKIVFDSNRSRLEGEPGNTSGLFSNETTVTF